MTPRRYFTVSMLDPTRLYAQATATSIEAVRVNLHDGLDAWLDDMVAPALREGADLQYLPPIRIDLR